MGSDHPVFGDVEEMVQEVLVPYWSMSRRETSEAAGEQVHVKESYLGPGIEGWCETKG